MNGIARRVAALLCSAAPLLACPSQVSADDRSGADGCDLGASARVRGGAIIVLGQPSVPLHYLSVTVAVTAERSGVRSEAIAVIDSSGVFGVAFGTKKRPLPPGAYRVEARFDPRDQHPSPAALQLKRMAPIRELRWDELVRVGTPEQEDGLDGADREFRATRATALSDAVAGDVVSPTELTRADDLVTRWTERYWLVTDSEASDLARLALLELRRARADEARATASRAAVAAIARRLKEPR